MGGVGASTSQLRGATAREAGRTSEPGGWKGGLAGAPLARQEGWRAEGLRQGARRDIQTGALGLRVHRAPTQALGLQVWALGPQGTGAAPLCPSLPPWPTNPVRSTPLTSTSLGLSDSELLAEGSAPRVLSEPFHTQAAGAPRSPGADTKRGTENR